MERFFYWYGKSISRRPWLYILICSALTGISALGLFRFHRESNGVKLWIPEHSEFRHRIYIRTVQAFLIYAVNVGTQNKNRKSKNCVNQGYLVALKARISKRRMDRRAFGRRFLPR